MDPLAARSLFDRAASSYGRVGPNIFGYFGARVLEVLRVDAGHSLLDLGCGTGAVSRAAFNVIGAEGRIIGIDLSPLMASAAKANGVVAAAMSADRLGFVDRCFDAVSTNFTLTYFEDPVATLVECRRVLKPGGRVGVVVHDGWWWQDDPTWEWHLAIADELRISEPNDRRFTQPDAVAALLAAAGFSRVSATIEPFALRWADSQEWWSWCWSHGYRAVLEKLNGADLARYHTACMSQLGDGPIDALLPVTVATALA